MSHLQAILFDLDGVIIDSEPLHEEAIRQTSIHLGRDLTKEELASFKGIVETVNAGQLLKYNPGATLSVQEVMAYRNNIYHQMFGQMTLIPGAREFIQRAHEKGLKLGLTTSALQENQRRVFEMFDLAPYFSAIVTSGDIVNGKPHPEPYLKTAEKLGVDPARSLVIEDSLNGVRSGKAAGCHVAALTGTFPVEQLKSAGADDVVETFAELEGLPFFRI